MFNVLSAFGWNLLNTASHEEFGLHVCASQFAAIYISHSCSASNRITSGASLQTESLPDVCVHPPPPPLSLRPSFLSFLPPLFFLFSSPKQWSHWKTWVQANPRHPSQSSRTRAHMHEQTHGSVRGIRPRQHLANEPWSPPPSKRCP